jgi:hypothetical protein
MVLCRNDKRRQDRANLLVVIGHQFPLLVVMSGEVETSLEINDRGAAEIVRDSSTSLGMTESATAAV